MRFLSFLSSPKCLPPPPFSVPSSISSGDLLYFFPRKKRKRKKEREKRNYCDDLLLFLLLSPDFDSRGAASGISPSFSVPFAFAAWKKQENFLKKRNLQRRSSISPILAEKKRVENLLFPGNGKKWILEKRKRKEGRGLRRRHDFFPVSNFGICCTCTFQKGKKKRRNSLCALLHPFRNLEGLFFSPLPLSPTYFLWIVNCPQSREPIISSPFPLKTWNGKPVEIRLKLKFGWRGRGKILRQMTVAGSFPLVHFLYPTRKKISPPVNNRSTRHGINRSGKK